MSLRFFIPIVLVAACSSNDKDSAIFTATWTKDVQPIMEQHCVRCHQGDGQGTGNFTSFEVVRNMAPLILNAIDAGTMPPGSADPDCHDYADSEKFVITTESRDSIAAWIDAETPYGEEGDLQVYDRSQSQLDNPNLVVTISEPYTPSFSDVNNAKNEYRCFALEHGQTEPFYITALHPHIDNTSMVHHVVLAKANDNAILEGSENKEGVDCIDNGAFIGGNFRDGAMLGGWAPGMSPVRFSNNAGLLVNPDDKIVIQMHYYQSDSLPEGASDQSGYEFEISTQRPENVITMAPLGLQGFTIPAGDESYTFSDTLTLPVGVNIWGIFPHMHVLGSGYEIKTDDECLLASDNYEFENQLTYLYKEPIFVPSGTNIQMSCTWNNSESNPDLILNPPQDIGYGERTDEEMCYAFTLVSLASQ